MEDGNERKAAGGEGGGRLGELDLSISLWGSWDKLNQRARQSDAEQIHISPAPVCSCSQLDGRCGPLPQSPPGPGPPSRGIHKDASSGRLGPCFSRALRCRTRGSGVGSTGPCHPIIEPQQSQAMTAPPQKRRLRKTPSLLSSCPQIRAR